MHVTWLSPLQVHAKAVLKDVEGAVPDEAPMMIWDDEIDLGWSEIEREGLREMGGFEARHSSEYSLVVYMAIVCVARTSSAPRAGRARG